MNCIDEWLKQTKSSLQVGFRYYLSIFTNTPQVLIFQLSLVELLEAESFIFGHNELLSDDV